MSKKNSSSATTSQQSSFNIFALLSAGKKIINSVNDRYSRQFNTYVYSGVSAEGTLKLLLNKNLNLNDRYELKICKIKTISPKLNILCNAANINLQNNNTEYSLIYSNDAFTDRVSDLVYDTICPLPNPIIFKADSDFEILIQLADK